MRAQSKNPLGFFSSALLVFLGALLFALSHPGLLSKEGMPPLAFFSLTPIFILCKKNAPIKSAAFGFAYGVLSYALFFHWLYAYDALSFAAVLFLCGAENALLFFALSLGSSACENSFFFMPFLWCFAEFLRTTGELGFSYGVMGYTQWNNPLALYFSSAGGVWFFSLLIALSGAVFSSLLLSCKKSRLNAKELFYLAMAFFCVVLTVCLLCAFQKKEMSAKKTLQEPKELSVVCVQNNTDSNKYGVDVYKRDIASLVRVTEHALSVHPETDLVVWPETAVVPPICLNFYDTQESERKKIVSDLLLWLQKTGCSFVIGNQHTIGEKDYNAALYFSPALMNVLPPEPAVYSKRHLVPFSECIPFERFFPSAIKNFMFDKSRLWERGNACTVFSIKGVHFSSPICFEDTFPGECRNFVLNGAEFLVNLTNDSWSQSLSAQTQHLSMAVFRAAENAVPLCRSTGNGITCIISRDGRVISMCEPFSEGYAFSTLRMYPSDSPTFYTRHGDWIPWGCFFILTLLFFINRNTQTFAKNKAFSDFCPTCKMKIGGSMTRNLRTAFFSVMVGMALVFAVSFNSCKTQVEVVEVTGVTLSSSNKTISEGGSTTLIATVEPSNATDQSVSWSVSDSSVLKLSAASGIRITVTGIKAGNATVTATASGKSAVCSFTVTEKTSFDDGDDVSTEPQTTENSTVVKGATDATSVGTSGKSFVASSSNADDYTVLVWSDEFEGTSLKTENWQYETGRTGWGNNESQNYTDSKENSEVKGGVLRITVKGDGTNDPTSARLKSQDKKYFKYGKLEARIKSDEGKWSWPAFWMLGENIDEAVWPRCGEIDIMEHAGTDDFIYTTLHWYNNGNADYGTTSASRVQNFDMNEWHVYTLEWTDSNISMYVDDVKTFNMGIGNSSAGTDCFNNPFFFVLNFAAGGQFFGNEGNWRPASDFAGVNWNMYVDYIRVYQDEEHLVDGVANVPVESISIAGDSSVTAGETLSLDATVTPSNATDKTVTWSSSDTSVATVSSSGVVTGVTAGSATIIAKAGTKSATKTVTVKAATVAVTDVSISGSSSVAVGETITLTASVTPANASEKTVTWSSSKTSVATVTSGGVVKGIAAGTATITAKAGTKTAAKTITVTAKQTPVVAGDVEQISETKAGYTLVWNDEFNSADDDGTPLSTKWGYDVGIGYSKNTDGTFTNNGQWGNNELQWYSENDPDNTYVSDGTLKIVAKKVTPTQEKSNMAYTSGRIVTRNLHTFKYGYIEMSAKIPNDAGVWPAFWMLDNDIYDDPNPEVWPGSGEIDIMESSVNLWQSDNVYGTLHCTAGSGGNPVFTQKSTVTFSDGKFHKYAVDWDDDHIDWYYDDVKVFTYSPSSYENDSWPFCDDFYIIINLAVGGNLGGAVPDDFTSSTMEIDYVRVWQKDGGYTDRSGAVVLEDAPTSTVAKTIPGGAKVIYDSGEAVTDPITDYEYWWGGPSISDYTAGGASVKQITLPASASIGGKVADISFSAGATLHATVYAKDAYIFRAVLASNQEINTNVSTTGSYVWKDVEVPLAESGALSKIGFISNSESQQTIWVDHVYLTEASGESGGSGDSGNTEGSGGNSGSGDDGIDWSKIEFAGNGSGNDSYTNKFKFYCDTKDTVGLINIQSSFGTEAGLYVTFPAAIASVSLGEGNSAIQGAGALFYVSKFTKKVTEFTVTAGTKTYTCYVYFADGTE